MSPPPGPSASDHNPFSTNDVESSIASSKSGQAFHIPSAGLSDSSPQSGYPNLVQIYCAACHRLSILKESLACTECICGLCRDCVDTIYSEQSRRRLASCPKCNTVGGKFKPFNLDIRWGGMGLSVTMTFTTLQKVEHLMYAVAFFAWACELFLFC